MMNTMTLKRWENHPWRKNKRYHRTLLRRRFRRYRTTLFSTLWLVSREPIIQISLSSPRVYGHWWPCLNSKPHDLAWKKTEKWLCVCLNLNNNPKPSWYVLSSTPKHKLIPAPPFPYGQYPSFSAVVSIGWEIYIIGGSVVKGKRSRRVYLLDCKSHQWRQLPKMCIARKGAYADVIDGKILLRGGCSKKCYFTELSREVYDPKTQTWEPCSRSLNVRFNSDSILVRAGLDCAQSI